MESLGSNKGSENIISGQELSGSDDLISPPSDCDLKSMAAITVPEFWGADFYHDYNEAAHR